MAITSGAETFRRRRRTSRVLWFLYNIYYLYLLSVCLYVYWCVHRNVLERTTCIVCY